MIDAQTLSKITQKKFDSLCAKHLHVKRLSKLHGLSRLVDWLAVAVPAIYFAIRFSAKGTEYGPLAEHVWEGLAGLLIALAALKIAYGWQDRAEKHSKLLGENIALVGQADYLATDQNTSAESARLFLVLAERSETADREALGQPAEKARQFAYREALKECQPDAVCPACNSSPWKFKIGSCQLCGNTPTPQSKGASNA
jgi:mobilome CxxCx(11)CxxC protein